MNADLILVAIGVFIGSLYALLYVVIAVEAVWKSYRRNEKIRARYKEK